MTNIFRSIDTLKGVARKRVELYHKLGIFTPFDLLYNFPRSYVDYSKPVPVNNALLNENNVVEGTIIQKFPEQRIRQGLSVYKIIATDGTDNFTIVFYNNVYASDALKVGVKYYFYGKITGNIIRREISSPQYIQSDSEILFKSVYHLTAGLTNSMLRTNISESLKMFEAESFEFMPEKILKENHICGLKYAIKNIHFPESREAMEMARRRLAFDELLNLQLGMKMMREHNCKSSTDYKMNSQISIDGFYGSIPFKLTDSQMAAIDDIIKDLCGNIPMNRLLQGDVGSGKTVVAAASCYFAAKNSCQTALMAPTEILANQHYRTLSSFLLPFGIKVCLLTGSMTSKQKNNIKSEIAEGEYSVIIGTHAIIQKDMKFKNLGLVITDEQHRFGVAQRNALAQKGNSPHRLVMSATPIPRTLAMMIYGDLDISIINELPAGRIPVETYAVTGGFRNRAYEFIKKYLSEGRQAYIVCPVIEQSESDLKSAVEYKGNITAGVFCDYNVGLLHGRMAAAEKENIMNDFKDGRIDLLVCTTVIEVGVDVPNAVIMMIENSDRFGLSQLHQLRGRVGRGKAKSYRILITENHSQETKQRLKVISSMTDGFKISEEDLRMRGPGDFFGHRQHGLPYMKIADIAGDIELVKLTQLVAEQITAVDSRLTSSENQGLRREVMRLFSNAEEE